MKAQITTLPLMIIPIRRCSSLNSGCFEGRLLTVPMSSLGIFSITCFSIWVTVSLAPHVQLRDRAYLEIHSRAAEACELAIATRKLGVVCSTFLYSPLGRAPF